MKFPRPAHALGVGLVLVAGCDYPTDVPRIDQRWVLPVESTTIGVDEMLPDDVTIVGGEFVFSVDPFATSQTLGQLCADCIPLNGLSVPSPGFTTQFSVTQELPDDVTGGVLSGGTIELTIQNDLSFDPIRLPSGATGLVTITVTDGPGGRELGQVVLNGATETLPAGQTVNKTISLASGAVGNSFVAVVDAESPAGAPTDLVTIDTSERFTVTAAPTDIQASAATVDVDGQLVEWEPIELEVEDLEDSFTDEITEGGLILEIVNPFGVAVNGTISIGSTPGALPKTLTIPATPTSTVIISYTGDELRSFLGQPDIVVSGSGTVSSGAPITVGPAQEFVIDASIDLTLVIG